VAERRTLEMELLRLIETTERGRRATRGQHAAILQIIAALERGFQVCGRVVGWLHWLVGCLNRCMCVCVCLC
jgi:hypothetical protein